MKSFSLLFSCVLPLMSLTADAARPTAEIVFDREPQERGMTFSRKFAEPSVVKTGGKDLPCWKVKRGGDPGKGWMRMLCLSVTDKRFRNGKMPIVDCEIEYVHTTQTSVEVLADTDRGVVRSGGRWGASPDVRKIAFSLDDARFSGAGRQADGVAGFDICIQAANGDWWIRRITLTGVDRSDNPDFDRLLAVAETHPTDRKVFYYAAGERAGVGTRIANKALVPFAGEIMFAVTSRNGEKLFARKDRVDIAAGQVADFKWEFSTEGWRKGVCDYAFEIRRDGVGWVAVVSRRGTIGLGSSSRMRKARAGEFRYGLDIRLGRSDNNPELMEWVRLLGVDLVRHGVDPGKEKEARETIQGFRRNGVEMLAVLDVPKDADEEAFERNLIRTCKFAGDLARDLHPPYWELGNEPDLPFFFPAGMMRYLDGLHPLYSSIKNADKRAVVSNGGLANASHRPESGVRVAEFFRVFDTNRIDRVAYHAHGPGAKAERTALEKLQAVARKAGRGDLAWVDTETGVAAKGPEQEMVQAATCVQKFVTVQSMGHPYMIWFRLLFEHPDSYGCLLTPRDPRPAVLAYRNCVEKLRGLSCAGSVPCDDRNARVYRFCGDSGRDMLVAWCEADEKSDSTGVLRIESDEKVAVKAVDLFGNGVAPRSCGARTVFALAFEPVFVGVSGGKASYTAARESRSPEDVAEKVVWVNGDPAAMAESDLLKVEPTAVIGERDVSNPYLAEPDASKWWRGEQDLSARLWASRIGEEVHLFVKVRDDEICAGDVIKVEVDGQPAGARLRSVRRVATESLIYRLVVDWRNASRLKVIIIDEDNGIVKQSASKELRGR